MEASAEPCIQLCPRFHAAVELIGKRWNGAIVRLLLGGARRFHDLSRGIPEISDKMLSERLKELEAASIVSRLVIPETPVRIEYSLTEKGRALEAPLDTLSEWAEAWLAVPEADPV
jgi:DNA-binding HxlR family transcriptional regulator